MYRAAASSRGASDELLSSSASLLVPVATDGIAHLGTSAESFPVPIFAAAIVAAFDVGAEESGELDGFAAGGEDGLLLSAVVAVISTVVRSTRASTICDAIVRFQINS